MRMSSSHGAAWSVRTSSCTLESSTQEAALAAKGSLGDHAALPEDDGRVGHLAALGAGKKRFPWFGFACSAHVSRKSFHIAFFFLPG